MGAFLLLMASANAQDCSVAGGETLAVASLNAWGLPYPLSTERRSRFRKISTYLDKEWDLVGLQEVWRGARHLMRRHVNYPASDGDSGLALYSRLPSSQPMLRAFRAAVGPDRLKSKGLLASQVQLEDGTAMWVVVTHLQAGQSERQQQVRAMQVAEVIDYLSELDGPAVVMGDFNLNRRQATDRNSHAQLEQAGLVDVAVAAGKKRPTYPGLKARLDRIYVRSAPSTCVVPQSADVGSDQLSDHLPIQARLRIHTGHQGPQ